MKAATHFSNSGHPPESREKTLQLKIVYPSVLWFGFSQLGSKIYGRIPPLTA
jgi:hypothetical protein